MKYFRLHQSSYIVIAESLHFPLLGLIALYLSYHLPIISFATYALVFSLLPLLEGLLTNAFTRSVVWAIRTTQTWQVLAQAVVRVYFIAGLLLALFLVISAYFWAKLWAIPSVTPYLTFMAIYILLFSLTHAYRSLLNGLERYTIIAWGSLLRNIARLGFILSFITMNWGIIGICYAFVLSVALELVWYARHLRFSLLGGANNYSWHNLYQYAVPLFAAAMCVRLYSLLDIFLIQFLGQNTPQTAFYAIAQSTTWWILLCGLIVNPLLILPVANALQQGETNDAAQKSVHIILFMTYLMPMVAFVQLLMPFIFTYLFPSIWADALIYIPFVLWSAYLLFCFNALISILIAYQTHRWIQYLTLPLPVISLIANVLLFPWQGILGIAFLQMLLIIPWVMLGVLVVAYITEMDLPILVIFRFWLLSMALLLGYQYLSKIVQIAPNLAVWLLPISGFLLIAYTLWIGWQQFKVIKQQI